MSYQSLLSPPPRNSNPSFMHQSIPAVPMLPRALAFFWKKWSNSRGWGHMSCLNAPGWGRRKRANARPLRLSPSDTSAVFILTGEFIVLWSLFQSHLRYQPGLKKANFRNFWFRDVQIKLFKNFHLKKNSTKKYSFSAKLLDIEVYYTLIVLITRWQVLSFWGNLSRNKSQGIVVSFYHTIHTARLL